MNSATIAALTVLAGLLSQVPEPEQSFWRKLESTPAIDTSDRSTTSMRITGSISLSNAIKLTFDAEYFKNMFKLVIYDGSDMMPLVVMYGSEFIFYDIMKQRIIFVKDVSCDISLKEEKNICLLNLNFAEGDPKSKGRVLLEFGGLFRNRNNLKTTFSKIDSSVFLVRQQGEEEDGPSVEATIDLSKKFIFRNFRYAAGKQALTISLSSIDANYDTERLALPRLPAEIQAIKGRSDVVCLKPGLGLFAEFRNMTEVGRMCVARHAIRLPKQDRAELIEALGLQESDINRIIAGDENQGRLMRGVIARGQGKK
jgi:hypothetical protein